MSQGQTSDLAYYHSVLKSLMIHSWLKISNILKTSENFFRKRKNTVWTRPSSNCLYLLLAFIRGRYKEKWEVIFLYMFQTRILLHFGERAPDRTDTSLLYDSLLMCHSKKNHANDTISFFPNHTQKWLLTTKANKANQMTAFQCISKSIISLTNVFTISSTLIPQQLNAGFTCVITSMQKHIPKGYFSLQLSLLFLQPPQSVRMAVFLSGYKAQGCYCTGIRQSQSTTTHTHPSHRFEM